MSDPKHSALADPELMQDPLISFIKIFLIYIKLKTKLYETLQLFFLEKAYTTYYIFFI